MTATTWAEANQTPCGHCRHFASLHGETRKTQTNEPDGGAQCGVCHCFQGPGSPHTAALREAWALSAMFRDQYMKDRR